MPVVEYRDKSWLVRAEVRSNETGTVAKTLETAGVTAPFAKDAVYRLMASLADRIQADFKAIGPGRSVLAAPGVVSLSKPRGGPGVRARIGGVRTPQGTRPP